MANEQGIKKRTWPRKLLIFLGLMSFVGYFALEAIKDAASDLQQGRIPKGIPDSILENIHIDREVNGDQWNARVGRVERGKDWANLFEIDVEVERPGGQIWTLKAPDGWYLEEDMRATIKDPKGTMTDKNILFYYSAPLAQWEQKSNEVEFKEGFKAWGELGAFSAGRMVLLPGGVMEAEAGATLKWRDQGENNP